MIKVLIFELRKLFHIRYLIFFFVFLLLINIFNIFNNYDLLLMPDKQLLGTEYCPVEKVNLQIDKDYEGRITSDKVSRLKHHQKTAKAMSDGDYSETAELYFPLPYTDMNNTGIVLNEMERLYSYKDNVAEPLLELNKDILNKAEKRNDDYTVRTAELIEKRYQNRSISDYYRVNKFEDLLTYNLSVLFLLFLTVYVSSAVFASEKETAMSVMLKCTVKGKKLFLIKTAAVLIFIFIASAVYFLADYIMFYICKRPDGIFMPVYSMKNFTYCPLNVSIFTFYIIISLIKIAGLFIVSVLGGLFSVIFSKSFRAFIASLSAVLILMGANLFTDGIFSFLRFMNPLALLSDARLFETLMVRNIFSFPVEVYLIMTAGAFAAGAILLAVSYRLFIRRSGND